MTIGIYALYWEKQDLIYIGQSQDIEARFKEHIRKMQKGNHTNYKVQDMYNLYGIPQLIIVEVCTINDLNVLEIYWTNEFDSINCGLNLVEAGLVGYGPNANNAKYSKLEILKVFRWLYRKEYIPLVEISRICGVGDGLPNDICSGKTHKWLKDMYPFQYNLMKLRRSDNKHINVTSLEKQGKQSIELLSPHGVTYKITNILKFCKENFANEVKIYSVGFSKLNTGLLKSYRGWKLK